MFGYGTFAELTFAQGPEAPAGGGDLSGSSSITFAASGNLLANAFMSGASSITFAASGNLGGSVSLSGSSALTFSVTGDLNVDEGFSGSAALTFSVSGNLSVSGEAPPLVPTGGGGGAVYIDPKYLRDEVAERNERIRKIEDDDALVFGQVFAFILEKC